MRVLTLLAASALTACVSAPRPRVDVLLPASLWPQDTQVHWYEVEGDTEAQLRASLDARGPLDPDGERNDAYTAWHVTWRFPFQQSEAGCTTGPVTSAVRVTMTLPKWRAPADGGPLLTRWRHYLEALKVHESGHRETGFQAATDITDALEALPPQPTCEEAEEVANATALSVLERYRQRDKEYDEATRHGETQGARFP